MQALLAVIMTWLSVSFALPAADEHPRLEFASAARMAEVRYSRLGAASPDRAASEAGRSAPAEAGRDVHAMYDDKTRTIYLPEGWTAHSAANVSILVHELVHHLQNAGGLKYECAGAREKAAYAAQARWLELFGKNLEDEFEIDAMTLFVRTSCMH